MYLPVLTGTGKTCSVRVFDRRSPIPQLECRLHALRGEGSCRVPIQKHGGRSYEGDKYVPQIGAVVSTVLRSACIEHVFRRAAVAQEAVGECADDAND